tara:strand:+ start:722 stop:961 length:240 start_codon:yes stop_codon:yes gene_type:complete
VIRKALTGREVEPSIAFRVILYSYCKAFSISPAEAQHTPMKLMSEMLQIHAEVEHMKSKEIEKEMKKHDYGKSVRGKSL